MSHLLEISDLVTVYDTPEGRLKAVDGVSLYLDEGETLGLVGESGCGKSVLALSILRLITAPGRIESGRILWRGQDLLALRPRQMRRIRGLEMAMIFQEPMTALNPVFTIGNQIAEAIVVHKNASWKQAMEEAVELLRVVAIPSPELRIRDYPHQLSGGMRQRVLMAMALSCQPALIIADEPTTALDVTIQAQIMALLEKLRHERGLAVLLITHDLGVVAEVADRVSVMYTGRIVEEAPVGDLFRAPRHPYTAGLLRSIPSAEVTGSKRKLPAIAGMVPHLARLPPGCNFGPRCPDVFAACESQDPPLYPLTGGRTAACELYGPEAPPGPAAEVSHEPD